MQGYFYNQQNQRIDVAIGAGTGEIGTEGLYFTDEPLEITSQVNDTFDVRLCSQASIRLLSKTFLDTLFSADFREISVTVSRDGETLFSGFIEPQAYSQPYNDELDEIELSCIDKLISLEYVKYGNIGKASVSYAGVKGAARQRTFREVITDILGPLGGEVLFADSVALEDGTSVWDGLSISELLFLGDTEGDVWTQAEVLDEMLRFLNLHIVQEGDAFRIFSWDSMPAGGTVGIDTGNVYDCGTTISVGEVYSRMKLTCDVKNIETVVDNPVDEDSLTKHYDMYQKYMTEYSADGEGTSAIDAFDAMTHGRKTDYGAGSITDWYVQVLRNPSWSFPVDGGSDILSYLTADGKTHQERVPDWLASHAGAALLAFGKARQNTAGKDNAPINKIDLTNYLCISVGGDGSSDVASCHPNESDLKARIPYAEYKGSSAGGNFSPNDDKTTNYIVVSGSVVLNPLMAMTDTYPNIRDYSCASPYPLAPGGGIRQWWHRTVPSRNNEDGRYYTRRYYKAETPQAAVEDNAVAGFVPFTDDGPRELEFKYSAIGESEDHISKVAVLQCMLVIGDMCVVETGTQGRPSDYSWQKFKRRDECRDDDEYYQQSFTVGFDPKLGDYLVGTEYDLQNNIDYTMNVDAKGTAIPIRKADGVSGDVKFTILGPVNTVWGEVTRRHPTFFRHTKWTETDRPLLARVSSIMLGDFKIGVYSDNGLTNNRKDCDIVYLSDTDERTVNDKEITFRISSALTTDECSQLGVTDTPNLSTPVELRTKTGVRNVTVNGILAKAEQHYISAYYNEYHTPHVLMEQNMQDTGGLVSLWNTYSHPAMPGKRFRVLGIDRNLEESSAKLHLKEI